MDNNDESKRQRLISRVRALGFKENIPPNALVTLEDFFDGNDDLGSIGCNLPQHPGLASFFEILKDLRRQASVQDVLVEVREVEEAHQEMWPFADTVWVLTEAAHADVANWLAPLEPDEVGESPAFADCLGAPQLKAGMKAYMVWWD